MQPEIKDQIYKIIFKHKKSLECLQSTKALDAILPRKIEQANIIRWLKSSKINSYIITVARMLIIPCHCFFLLWIFIYGTIFIIVTVFGITGVFQLGITCIHVLIAKLANVFTFWKRSTCSAQVLQIRTSCHINICSFRNVYCRLSFL